MKKNSMWCTVVAFIIVFLGGAAAMRIWDVYRRTPEPESLPGQQQTQSVWLMDMDKAATAQNVVDLSAGNVLKESAAPSQLSKIEIPGLDRIISRTGDEFVPPEESSSQDAQKEPVSLQASSPAQDSATPAPEESKISMIEAPVKALRIQSVEQYREFKRRARGSYPQADFTKQEVLVLESTSNLPDKVFEIDSVKEENGKRVVRYRVNVFGLDKKTNTHSAVLISKKDLPIELKQVL